MPQTDWVHLDFKQGIVAESGTWYNNLQMHGYGGNAVTYLMLAGKGAYHGVCFAVKVFRRVSMPERRQQFLREVKFLRDRDHPGIMRIYDEGVYQEDYPFVVAEYLPRTLADVIRGNTATLVEKLSFVLQLLSTLEYLDQLETPIVHRDIKPQNIFVKGHSCVLGDFGLMKPLTREEDPDARKTAIMASVRPGMPLSYRTPDLVSYARGERELTTKSDVFQLGLVAAQLFSGENPQRRAKHKQPVSEVRMKPVARILGSFGRDVANKIAFMLAPDPDSRWSAAELLAPWRELFFAVAEQQHAIEGRVFR